MKFDKVHLILTVLLIGLILYINFCQEKDTYTKKQGEDLAKLTEQSLQKLNDVFIKLETLDSSKIINNYYTTKYETEKQHKDSLVNSNPELADSLFLYYVRKLRSEPSPFDLNAW